MDRPTEPPDVPETQAVAAQTAPNTRLDRILALVPRALSSHAHIIFLGVLGVFLVLLPLLGVSVSAKDELIGGNYTNVTSDIGACIAAGGTLTLIAHSRKRSRLDAERKKLAEASHKIIADLWLNHTGTEHEAAIRPVEDI